MLDYAVRLLLTFSLQSHPSVNRFLSLALPYHIGMHIYIYSIVFSQNYVHMKIRDADNKLIELCDMRKYLKNTTQNKKLQL